MKTYTKLELDMDWSFIRDKQIELLDGSDADSGVILIVDSDDMIVRMIGYELINKKINNAT